VGVGVLGKGLHHLSSTKQLQAYPVPTAFNQNSIPTRFSIGARFGHEILLGTIGNGIFTFDPATKKYRIPFPVLGRNLFENKTISSLWVEANRRIWIGTTASGVYVYDIQSQEVQHFEKTNAPQSLRYNHVTYVYQDRMGRIWVLTNGGDCICTKDPEMHFETLLWPMDS